MSDAVEQFRPGIGAASCICAAIDVQWRRFLSLHALQSLGQRSRWTSLVYEIPKFLFNAVQDRSKKASVPKIGSIRSSVSIELRLVTDRLTDTGP